MNDYALEFRLRQLSPELHRLFTNAVFGLQNILSNYKLLFPMYTDHSELHSLDVIEFCNYIIGDQIDRLNADEIYILLMGCYFHDTGMGLTEKDYYEFCKNIDFGDFFEKNDKNNTSNTIRAFHHEFSGQFIKKYADFFEIPSKEHLWSIIQVSRGHRKTDLMDEKEYPIDFKVPSGNSVCLPYLGALIRLADEIDVAANRNSLLLFDMDIYEDDTIDYVSAHEFMKHNAIKNLVIHDEEFILQVQGGSQETIKAVLYDKEKMMNTLNVCRKAVNDRTKYTITQSNILIEELKEDI